jgi:hypothetical protein
MEPDPDPPKSIRGRGLTWGERWQWDRCVVKGGLHTWKGGGWYCVHARQLFLAFSRQSLITSLGSDLSLYILFCCIFCRFLQNNAMNPHENQFCVRHSGNVSLRECVIWKKKQVGTTWNSPFPWGLVGLNLNPFFWSTTMPSFKWLTSFRTVFMRYAFPEVHIYWVRTPKLISILFIFTKNSASSEYGMFGWGHHRSHTPHPGHLM